MKVRTQLSRCCFVSLWISWLALATSPTSLIADDVSIVPVWPQSPPSWTAPGKPESSTSEGRSVAGKTVQRVTNVTTPELHVYESVDAGGIASETAVVICPGGGFSILAWDLEGTEIAQRFQAGGVTAIVLKYRVPSREADLKWLPAVQDLQRSVAIVRAGRVTSTRPATVGVMGFSAGGHTAARAATATERLYDAVDEVDQTISPPDFACLIYPAYLVDEKSPNELVAGLEVTHQTPRMFLAHGEDDRLTVLGSVTMFRACHAAGVPATLHVFTGSGHGFGGRDDGRADDHWPRLCLDWLADEGLLVRHD